MEAKEILAQVEAILYAQNKSKYDFARELSRHTEKPRPVTPASMITMYRWFTGKNKPRKTSLLAIQKWIASQTNTKNAN